MAQTYPTRPLPVSSWALRLEAGNDIASAAHWSMALRAARPIFCHRKSAWCWWEYCNRGRRAFTCGRLHTSVDVFLANATNATLYDKLNFNFIQDIVPIAGIVRVPNVMLVNPALPVNSVPEFIDYARANPGRVNMGSGGTGGPVHMVGALFNILAGLQDAARALSW